MSATAAGTAYMRMRPGEAIADALRRISAEQLEIAKLGFTLEGDESIAHEQVHSARKALKRVRALLRLVRSELDPDAYRNEDAVLRDQGRRLAELRRNAVYVKTLASLEASAGAALPPRIVSAFRDRLSALRTQELVEFRADENGTAAARTALACAQARFASWSGLDAIDNATVVARLEPAIRRAHEKGAAAMRKAKRDPREAVYHGWRKRVNHLRYEIEALSIHLPPQVTGLAPHLDELSETLGQAHDLDDLARLIEQQPELLPGPEDCYTFTVAAEKRRYDLHRRALRMAKRAYGKRVHLSPEIV